MLASATGLYRMADVVLDASESKNICLPLNTSYTLLISSQSAGIEDQTLVSGLAGFHKEKQVTGVVLKDKCEAFMSKTLNYMYPIDNFSALDLKKEFDSENISRSDCLILRELMKVGIHPPFYVRVPHRSELLTLNVDGSMSFDGKDSFDYTAETINDFISSSLEKEKITNIQCSEMFDLLNEGLTPVYFDENVDIFNEIVTAELIIEYKKKLISYIMKMLNEKDYQSYLGTNKNTLMLFDMVNTNRDVLNTLYK